MSQVYILALIVLEQQNTGNSSGSESKSISLSKMFIS